MNKVKKGIGLSPEERAQAASLRDALLTFRSVDPKLSIEEAYTLLSIAARPGLLQKELGEELALTAGSLSRVFAHLNKRGDRGRSGLGLLHMEDDPSDWRQKLNYLTHSGETLVRAVLRDVFDGGNRGSPAEGE